MTRQCVARIPRAPRRDLPTMAPPTLNLDITMSSITPHLTALSIPPGTEHKAFEVSIPHLAPDAGGWAWYRPR